VCLKKREYPGHPPCGHEKCSVCVQLTIKEREMAKKVQEWNRDRGKDY
jgi:hypothetical protein